MDEITRRANELQVEEFSILELEDRLELQERCNNNCTCEPEKPKAPSA